MIMKTMLEYVIKSRNLYSDKIHYVNYGHDTDYSGMPGGGSTVWPKTIECRGVGEQTWDSWGRVL